MWVRSNWGRRDSPALHKVKVMWFLPSTELWLPNLRGERKVKGRRLKHQPVTGQPASRQCSSSWLLKPQLPSVNNRMLWEQSNDLLGADISGKRYHLNAVCYYWWWWWRQGCWLFLLRISAARTICLSRARAASKSHYCLPATFKITPGKHFRGCQQNGK